MATEITRGQMGSDEWSNTKDGIYVHIFDSTSTEWSRVLNNRVVWTVFIRHPDYMFNCLIRFSFLILSPDFSNEYTSKETLDNTNEIMVAEFNRLISEIYPEDLDSVIKLQSELTFL
jgi:hypothetical protein